MLQLHHFGSICCCSENGALGWWACVCVYCSAGTTQYVSDVNNAFSSERHVLLFHWLVARERALGVCTCQGQAYLLLGRVSIAIEIMFRRARTKSCHFSETAKKDDSKKQNCSKANIKSIWYFPFRLSKARAKKKSTNIQNLMKFYRLFFRFHFHHCFVSIADFFYRWLLHLSKWLSVSTICYRSTIDLCVAIIRIYFCVAAITHTDNERCWKIARKSKQCSILCSWNWTKKNSSTFIFRFFSLLNLRRVLITAHSSNY